MCRWALREGLLVYPIPCLWVVVRNALCGGVSNSVNIILDLLASISEQLAHCGLSTCCTLAHCRNLFNDVAAGGATPGCAVLVLLPLGLMLAPVVHYNIHVHHTPEPYARKNNSTCRSHIHTITATIMLALLSAAAPPQRCGLCERIERG